MPDAIDDLLNNAAVRDALKQAWLDSNPGESGGHETGGFIVREASGTLAVIRWPKGERTNIDAPAHTDGKAGNSVIVASFHTHPNTGEEYTQEPSLDDMIIMMRDDDLKGGDYIGEFVISLATLYLILPHGGFVEVGSSAQILGV